MRKLFMLALLAVGAVSARAAADTAPAPAPAVPPVVRGLEAAARPAAVRLTPEALERLREMAATRSPVPVRRVDGVPPGIALVSDERGVCEGRAPTVEPASFVLLPAVDAATGEAPEAAGDIMASSPHSAFFKSIRGYGMAGANKYYSMRFPTSHLGRQLPFNIDSMWMFIDQFYTCSANWQMSVMLEDPANPFRPRNPATTTPLAGPATLNTLAINGQAACPAAAPAMNPLRNARVPFNAATGGVPYPAAAMFSINDGTHNDDFTGANGTPIIGANNWIECTGATCNPASFALQIDTNRARVTAGTTGTRLGWRLHDPAAAPVCNPLRAPGTPAAPCVRYLHDIIEGSVPESRYGDPASPVWFNPDQDVRLTVDYDLTAASATAAGVFFRAAFTGGLGNYYSAVVVKGAGGNTLQIRATDAMGVVTMLASTPVTGLTGTLTADVQGYLPVRISATAGAATVTYSDTTTTGGRPFRGDVTWGNIFGVIAPGAGGGEAFDTFRVLRNADLFATIKFPTGATVGIFGEGNVEGREFYNVFFNFDLTNEPWEQSYVCSAAPACADCTQMANAGVALQVREPQGQANHSLFQVNHSLVRVDMPCCTANCLTNQPAFACALSNNYIDTCTTPQQGVRPNYSVGEPIEIWPNFWNEFSPGTSPMNAAVWFFWWACLDTDVACINDPFTNCTQGTNCDIYNLLMPPGQNVTNVPPGTGPGLYTLAPGPTTPIDTFTPPAQGDYHLFVLELYDLNGDGMNDIPNPDNYLPNLFVQRPFNVGGCATIPYNLDKNSLKMARSLALDQCGDMTQLEAQWGFQTPGPQIGMTMLNLHELTGSGTKDQIANPFANSALTTFTGQPTPPASCFSPSAVTDVNYYGLFQADACTGLSDPDQ